jgi:hypothetical protein
MQEAGEEWEMGEEVRTGMTSFQTLSNWKSS